MAKRVTKTKDEVAISVKGVSKYFSPSTGQRTIKQAITSLFKRKEQFSKDGYWAVKDVSFDIKKGEFFGIVGRNGSGKSTLLKIIAGVYTPTKGDVSVSGKLVPFIELGVGFNPELSGKDNVFLNGALLGFSRKEMLDMYDEIVEFAELEDHMDVKLKNFSSGMQVRLAFSIAIRAKADVLLIDEVLAVGDANFQKKCYEYFAYLKKQKATVVFVSHDSDAIERFCSRAVFIDNGNLTANGTASQVVGEYTAYLTDRIRTESPQLASINAAGTDFDLTVLVNGIKNHKVKITNQPKIKIDVGIKSKRQFEDEVFVGITIYRSDGQLVFWSTTEGIPGGHYIPQKGSTKNIRLELDNVFGESEYYVHVVVKNRSRTMVYLDAKSVASFNIIRPGKFSWLFSIPNTLVITSKKAEK
jgi:ABC-2 type transport system ATP-binding protein